MFVQQMPGVAPLSRSADEERSLLRRCQGNELAGNLGLGDLRT
jgi:hypothetical protein